MKLSDLMLKREEQMMMNDFSYHMLKIAKKYWKQFFTYSKKNNIDVYDNTIKNAFLNEYYNYNDIPVNAEQRNAIRALWILEDFEDYMNKNTKIIIKLTKFQEIYNNYLIECKNNYNADNTLNKKKIVALKIFSFLENNIAIINNINNDVINDCIANIEEESQTNNIIKEKFWVLRDILKYLYNNNYTKIDYSYLIPHVKKVCYKKLPNSLTKDDIEKFLHEAKKYNKRDYAIFLLGIRYGMRISDVLNLKKSDISWNDNTITITQNKTKIKNQLPLTNEVGEAIAEYLLEERPKVVSEYIFLSRTGPFTKLKRSNLYETINRIIQKSDMLDKTKRGFHSFRHTIASVMVKEGTSATIISSTLGHLNTQTLKNYININEVITNQCSLEDNIYE